MIAALLCLGCARRESGVTLTFPGSALGAESEILQRQLARFMTLHPAIHVVQRRTPDDADQRHQLYVQWLNAHAGEPDILQLDVVWTPEFAAAGWILPLDAFHPDTADFFPATLAANRWRDTLYALPWFVDAGMLYRRTDLVPRAPGSLAELVSDARAARDSAPAGFVWQGARYEGLITVFTEVLAAYGGEITDREGRVRVDGEPAVRALTWLRDAIYRDSISPPAVLTWHEEQTRFAFQNSEAVFMRNWPYAYPLLQDSSKSRVAGRVAVSPMPAGPGGEAGAALGGSQLAINARTRHPDSAYVLLAWLTAPAQMSERARAVGQFPPRPSLYAGSALAGALPIPPGQVEGIIAHAVPRPVTPVYTELSQILQIWLHRALSHQAEPRDALAHAAAEMRALLRRVGLSPDSAA